MYIVETTILGVALHLIGGFASGSFYIPYKKVRGWAWESYWIAGGLVSWLIVPFVAAELTVPGYLQILRDADFGTLLWTYLFGVLWGIGGLTFGLTMRYLGLSLGMSIVLGLTSALGALIPPLYRDLFTDAADGTLSAMLTSTGGYWVLFGVFVSLIGIGLCGRAGVMKEREVPDETKFASVSEFSLSKGALVALISGVLSACFSYGISAGQPLAEAAVAHGANPLFQNNVTFMVIMWGGLTTNALWCLWLNRRNGTYRDYTDRGTPLLRNYLLVACAGTLWYLQFFFYGMGESRLHNDASSWVLHMSFIIIVSNCWGLYFREWQGTSQANRRVLLAGISVILLAIVNVGYGNYLN
ncbi:rhamnose-proton symporter [Azotobacter vinelandii CA]|uniref:RhaT l-rhamnose-proton symport 2 n=2 Tax=Azotobacter vinelandii TaxID=354 RepID=C1DMX4_AZOVD|nr:L-rhamnose/proton symporter RhaT [Azotobacter vinelandii]ACO77154.1 RhaT l-rhamnose-proton symport 2 [Azotobacter vinelandii DJ]AGK13161.1 rhamnose-proton symporter [Azotobacter vinelandii CA]AGK19593.1 rhamnose-proton symporter [Azotobacter vinelandii CA6]WKN22873.1 L-rhamnose/proton symporter RhaT [Azotobacter vinelandii]GLK62436.1 L-rhamnose-proton symporter [Azotobacter vinelandii]